MMKKKDPDWFKKKKKTFANKLWEFCDFAKSLSVYASFISTKYAWVTEDKKNKAPIQGGQKNK